MLRMTVFRWLVVGLFVTTYVIGSQMLSAQSSESAVLASQLADLMTSAQLDAVASKDSIEDDRFVAALAFPGQLLVVSARYKVPLYVNEKIANKQYRDVYIDLNTAFIAGTKILITDAGANGLLVEEGAVDVVDDGSSILRLDDDADVIAVSNADQQYSRMLKALIEQAR